MSARLAFAVAYGSVAAKRPNRGGKHMRATTPSNKMSSLPGASVASVEFTLRWPVVGLRRRGRHLTFPT